MVTKEDLRGGHSDYLDLASDVGHAVATATGQSGAITDRFGKDLIAFFDGDRIGAIPLGGATLKDVVGRDSHIG